MKNVTIVCDGSSLGNGKGTTRAAAVAVLGFKGIWKAVGEYLGNATNQQAEIAAATVGLKNLKEPCKVKLLSDSRYVVETMGGTWKRKTNQDWWEKLDRAAAKHDITWEWTKGHAGHAPVQLKAGFVNPRRIHKYDLAVFARNDPLDLMTGCLRFI